MLTLRLDGLMAALGSLLVRLEPKPQKSQMHMANRTRPGQKSRYSLFSDFLTRAVAFRPFA
jgi:hypothetical protein